MSRRKIQAGTTSFSLPIFVQATNSTTGGGLSGLVFNTASLVAEYRRAGQSTWTTVTLVTKTLGTYTSGGFIADGALGGAYEFDLPNAALASGARFVLVRLRGAANMLPVLIEIELDAVDYQTAAFGAATPAQVNAEMLDVLSVDTFAELSAPPAANSTLKDKLTWLFMWARNRATQTATHRRLYADNTTTIVSTESVSDDGITYDKGEAS